MSTGARLTGGGTQLRRIGTPAWVPLVVVALIALLLGVGIGRMSGGSEEPDGVVAVTNEVVPLSVDGDGLWTAGGGDLPAIGEQLAELRRDPASTTIATIATSGDDWLEAYDTLLRRMVGVQVAHPARPVQRQFVTSLTLSRDAVELLVAAAAADDPVLRRDLSSEALRLRTRAEQVTQVARASLADLTGRETSGVSEPDPLPTLEELR